ncbi:MAG: hypothetical protein IT246_07635 [Bacteroidia bacterium]|nr:hypothetical protein [Bacteroidia bacterium]
MKKLLIAFVAVSFLGACHYGQKEAEESLKRNDEYKSEKKEYSVHRAGEYGYTNETPNDTTTVISTTDTTKAE